MAEGFLRSFDPRLEVFSAGTHPSTHVHARAVQVMKEAGIDLSDAYPKSVERFLHEPFDYVITVCDSARETCPVFTGTVRHRVHIGFDDPASATGTEKAVTAVFRRVRDEISEEFRRFYETELHGGVRR
jgi:arsenate reductase